MEQLTFSDADKIKAIQEAYIALNRNDISGFIKIFDPHIERVEPEGFPESGVYRGIEAVAAHFLKARSSWAEGSCEPKQCKTIGDHTIVSVHVHVRLKDETEWREGDVADLFTFRNGKVTLFRTFLNEQQALAAVESAS